MEKRRKEERKKERERRKVKERREEGLDPRWLEQYGLERGRREVKERRRRGRSGARRGTGGRMVMMRANDRRVMYRGRERIEKQIANRC